MRAVVQRVASASVVVENAIVGTIGGGLLAYLGVGPDDTRADADWMADKMANLRIFPDGQGAMNRSLLDEGGGLLLISQFTLFADARRGRRPSFSGAAGTELARALYGAVSEELLQKWGIVAETGIFQTQMLVESINDGPVTILLDSKKTF